MSAPVLLNLLHKLGKWDKISGLPSILSVLLHGVVSYPDVMIFRDYLMVFWLWPEVSTRDPIISL